MTEDQKALVTETWRKVVPIADKAASLFYGRLFELEPGLKRLFVNTAMDAQRTKLVAALGSVVDGLDRLEEVVPVLEDLGRRHVGYGVRDEHYDTVGEALLWTLEAGLGEAWTAEVKSAWAAAYTTVSGVMSKAARDSGAGTLIAAR